MLACSGFRLQRGWAVDAEEEEEGNRGAELPHRYKGPSDPAEVFHPHYNFSLGFHVPPW